MLNPPPLSPRPGALHPDRVKIPATLRMSELTTVRAVRVKVAAPHGLLLRAL